MFRKSQSPGIYWVLLSIVTYDPDSEAPYKMNLSELAEYDDLFPDHPLSQCRMLIRHDKENL